MIKAAQVAGPGDVRDLERYHVDFHLLDARAQALEKQALRGGTGETFDWALLSARRSKVPLILSGGLKAENVAEAIAATGPFAVDSASGTESAPGEKDAEKLRAFFAAVERPASDEENTPETERRRRDGRRCGRARAKAPRRERSGAPLRAVRRAVRAGDADAGAGGAGAGVAAGARGPGLPG